MATWLVETCRRSLCVLTIFNTPCVFCWYYYYTYFFNPLNAELNPICHLLALIGAHHIFHVSGLRVNAQTMVHINLAKYYLEEMYSNEWLCFWWLSCLSSCLLFLCLQQKYNFMEIIKVNNIFGIIRVMLIKSSPINVTFNINPYPTNVENRVSS